MESMCSPVQTSFLDPFPTGSPLTFFFLCLRWVLSEKEPLEGARQPKPGSSGGGKRGKGSEDGKIVGGFKFAQGVGNLTKDEASIG